MAKTLAKYVHYNEVSLYPGSFPYTVEPRNTVTNGPKKLAVLTGERINEGFFYKKM